MHFVLLLVVVTSNLIFLASSDAVQQISYTNVGGTGTYPQVTNMISNSGVWNVCPDSSATAPVCATTPVTSSGSLAPFDEDLTLLFRGPMQINNIAVYYPATSYSSWTLTSYWDTTNANTINLVWLNNAGVWSICQGNGQSYMSSDGTSAATSPQPFNGVLGNNVNVNVMTAADCTPSACPGFYRGVAKQGWTGICGEKMFVVTVTMPHDTTGSVNNDMPAIWILNGQVVRTNQWGCNCRGMGADGGCGELDVAEVITTGSEECTSTFYSFKQSLGAGTNYFARPISGFVTYVVVFDSAGTGTISLLEQSSFSYPTTIDAATVSNWISSTSPSATVTLTVPNPAPPTECYGIYSDQDDPNAELKSNVNIGVAVGASLGVLVLVVIVVVIVKRKQMSSNSNEIV